jgi:hypothetical protein
MGLLRTILRRSFFAAAAVSTLLLLATLIVWPVSYYRTAGVEYTQDNGSNNYCYFGGWNGRAVVLYDKETASDGPRRLGFNTHTIAPGQTKEWSYLTWNTDSSEIFFGLTTSLGVAWEFYAATTPSFVTVWCNHWYIPFSYLALLFSILPLLAFRSIRRRRRARRNSRLGLCPKCGYDLRAQHAGSGGAVCPECGTPVAGRGPSPGGGGRP